nr:MAG TPA: hypothetical protein [Caudoviricetes sp.]
MINSYTKSTKKQEKFLPLLEHISIKNLHTISS